MGTEAQPIYSFAGFSLDTGAGLLRDSSGEIALRPKSLDVLTFLVRNAGRVVSKDELLQTIWSDVIVTEDSLTQCISDIRRSLGPRGEGLIRTVPKRGYMLPGEALKWPPAVDARPTLQLPDKPSLVVLPFENLSSDPEQSYLADGTVEEITAALARIRGLFVISRNSAFSYRGRPLDLPSIGRELGVRYVLEGSVRRHLDQLRISARLVEAETTSLMWAEGFKGEIADAFALQDEVTAGVAGAILPSIQLAEIERARRKRPGDLQTYDLVMRSLPHVWALARRDNAIATETLEQALLGDPDYPLALSLLSWCHAQRSVYNWSAAPGTDRYRALRLAERSIDLGGDDPFSLAVLGAVHTVSRNLAAARALLEKACSIDPNSAFAWNRSGWVAVYRDEVGRAVECFERSMRLGPFDPMVYTCRVGLAVSHFTAGRPGEAADLFLRVLVEHPNALWILRSLIPALVEAGRVDEARRHMECYRHEYPALTLRAIRDSMPYGVEILDRHENALRSLGMPE
ncbi:MULTISPECIES: winged helix-turn-helix domain-containing tetratricopeptide repeat protein [Mesorhizobium]|uniref:Winged helix-turn-helix domain-containing protein n=2 Tax=Mesorhizobium opportunistum TaxID=593909 RepID=A0ABV1YBH3_9HYPH|nr:winged helix-turn-helix domain-containing protein [Mesorhizobium sp.]TIN90723.1 MAG: tetratricopeptide repeat protein [Mesorhizobium sp.]TJU97903.1 MAG: tetratricopeptide repeat protein [Mesorhizobium sp.]TJV16270.1 MAG: tetratricopeptide repeat protein [Mesorhizobium sp.]